MRWIRFTAGGRTAYGIVEGSEIVEVTGDPFAGHARTARRHALGAVKIEVPIMKLPFLQTLAPTQSEPPFFVTQFVVLAIFIVLGLLAAWRFHPEQAAPA